MERPVQSPTLENFVDPLPLLRPQRPQSEMLGRPLYDIAVSAFRQRLHRDLPPTPLWGYAA